MILLALSLFVAVESRPLPQTAPDVTVAPATAPQGVFEPPNVPPRTALGASSVPPEPPDDGDGAYAETTRMYRIARGILGTAAVGSMVVVLVHTCAG